MEQGAAKSNSGTGQSHPLRLGRLGFVNVLPVYLFLERDGSLFRESAGTPSMLNKMLREARLDVSPASSVEYARAAEDYWILRDLSISCHGKVKSVLLLSGSSMGDWRQAVIQCPRESETSVALLQLLLKNYWGVEASLIHEDSGMEAVGFLRIGDRALEEMASGKWAHAWDLGEAWLAWTGLPFVFALWLVREEAVNNSPVQLYRLHQALLKAKDLGLEKLDACAAKASGMLGGVDMDFLDYFRGLSFDLKEEHIRGLDRFFEELLKAGLIGHRPVLRFFP